MPCRSLSAIDKRYRTRYGMSMVENLVFIKNHGMGKFLKAQERKYRCFRCGRVVCVHNDKCYDCEKIKSWKN